MSKKNNYGFNDFSFIERTKIPKYLVIICAILVTSLTIGFASFSSSLVMKNIAMIRVDKTVRLTGISVNSTNSGAISRTEEYNVSNIFGDIVLPSKDSSVKYEVDITNLGNVKMGAIASNPICTPVTTATTGNVPSGNFNYGDEYTCQVGDSYTNTFFVLENSGDTVSLIMKENFTDSYVPQAIAWCTDGGSDNATCKNINSTGSEASDGQDYIGHIKSVFNKEGVEVSFPSASQIATSSGKTFNNENLSGLSTWLYDYLQGTTHPVSGIGGYLTATPAAGKSRYAWYVSRNGILSIVTVIKAGNRGVRPVITLSKSSFSSDTNLDYTIDNYNNNDVMPVCDGDNCTNGVTKKIYVTIKYKDGIDDSLVTSEPQNFNIGFDYKQIFKVTYDGVTCTDCATEVLEGNTYTATIDIDLEDTKIIMDDIVLTKDVGYTYNATTKLLTISNVDGNIIISDSYICKPVTEATTGNKPQGNYAHGDEYTCKVGNDYSNTFFVLENNTDTISLIMKENYTDSYVPKTPAWCTDGGSNGSTCKNITSTGSNATSGKDYLGHIKEIFNKDGVEVSFPSASQIATASGKTFNGGMISDLSTWLYDYLAGTTHPVSGLNGYWTITPSAGNSASAYAVFSSGSLSTIGPVSYPGINGVRPVITISKGKVKIVESVEPICTRVTEATTGNVPTGNYAYGDEYVCDVGDGEPKTFFVLEASGGNVSLIMNTNVGIDGKSVTSSSTDESKAAWISKEDYVAAGGTESDYGTNGNNNKGPITANKALREHTSTWTNVSASQITLPSANQIAKASGQTFNNARIDGLPIWLYDYLDNTTHAVSAVYGYWTSTSNVTYLDQAWRVSCDGYLPSTPVSYAVSQGIRPVITISKSLIN